MKSSFSYRGVTCYDNIRKFQGESHKTADLSVQKSLTRIGHFVLGYPQKMDCNERSTHHHSTANASRILTKQHAGHQGSESKTCKLRARTAVSWRKMNNDFDRACRTCNTCQEMQNCPPKQPLIQTEVNLLGPCAIGYRRHRLVLPRRFRVCINRGILLEIPVSPGSTKRTEHQ